MSGVMTMKMRHTGIARVMALIIVVSLALLSACQRPFPTPTPVGPTEVPVRATFALMQGPSYSRDIQPVFDYYCISCHGSERAENGLRLDSYEGVMAGTRFGPVLTPGSPEFSTLYYTIAQPASQQVAMPQDAHRLSPNRILNIKYWIQAGAKND